MHKGIIFLEMEHTINWWIDALINRQLYAKLNANKCSILFAIVLYY